MKEYVLKSLRELFDQAERQRLLEREDGAKKVIEFFASRYPGGGNQGERRTEGDRGNERGLAAKGEGNSPEMERDGGQNLDVLGG